MTELQQISEHVFWLPPGPPDRPSLGAVVGERDVVMLDAGASDAHAQLFLDLLARRGIPAPSQVVLTHWHWDHVLGAVETGASVLCQRGTAAILADMAGWDWSDAGLAGRVARGEETETGAANIRAELPAPRRVRIARPARVFDDCVDLPLGGVTCRVRHVGGDHAEDSSVVFIEPDGVLFLGDCLYEAVYAPRRHYTVRRLLPMLDALGSFAARVCVDGHDPVLASRAGFEGRVAGLREAVACVRRWGTDEGTVFAAFAAETGRAPDEEMAWQLRAVMAGCDS